MVLLIRNSAFWHNSLTIDNQAVYERGPFWSGFPKTSYWPMWRVTSTSQRTHQQPRTCGN